MMGRLTSLMLPHLSGVPHLHVNRPLDVPVAFAVVVSLGLY